MTLHLVKGMMKGDGGVFSLALTAMLGLKVLGEFGKAGEVFKTLWVAYYALGDAHTPVIVEHNFTGKSSYGSYGDTILQMHPVGLLYVIFESKDLLIIQPIDSSFSTERNQTNRGGRGRAP